MQTLSMERAAVRLIAFLSHERPAVQHRIRELGGLQVVLHRAQLDERNPQIREWAILAVRNLTEGCPENQEFIAGIERTPREVVNAEAHAAAGLEVAVDRSTGKVRVKQQQKPDPQPKQQEGVSSTLTGDPGTRLMSTVCEEPDGQQLDPVLEELQKADSERQIRVHRVEM